MLTQINFFLLLYLISYILNQSIDYEKLYNKYVEMFFRFLSLSAFIFDNVEDMVQAYIIKNVENIRRQKLGY